MSVCDGIHELPVLSPSSSRALRVRDPFFLAVTRRAEMSDCVGCQWRGKQGRRSYGSVYCGLESTQRRCTAVRGSATNWAVRPRGRRAAIRGIRNRQEYIQNGFLRTNFIKSCPPEPAKPPAGAQPPEKAHGLLARLTPFP